jgi:protoheme IX farnesyltransferase
MARAIDTATRDTLEGETALGHSELADYWTLLKPNVMKLVVFTGGVGLFIAPGSIHPLIAFVAILAMAVGAGASAAINNAYDSDIDAFMVRTRRRPTASGRIAPAEALAMGITLAIASIGTMGLAVNWTAAGILALTIGFYVLVYTMWLKRRTPQNIVIGGAAGAFPPLIGWAAVTGSLELMPILLFLVVFFWTPPHFWALALYREKDYANVGVPMLPVTAGAEATRRQILGYSVVLAIVSLLPTLLGSAGWLYLGLALVLSSMFLRDAWQLYRQPGDRRALRLFKFSIVYLFALFAAILADHLLLGWLLGWLGA